MAGRRGARSAVGVCWDGAGAPGLWPWVQVLRALRAALGDDGWDRASPIRPRRSDAAARHGRTRLVRRSSICSKRRCNSLRTSATSGRSSFSSTTCSGPIRRRCRWWTSFTATRSTCRCSSSAHTGATRSPGLTIPNGWPSPTWPRRRSRSRWPGWTTTASASSANTSACPPRPPRPSTFAGSPAATRSSSSSRWRSPTRRESLGVRRAVDRRVDALGDIERRVLSVASVIGREAPDALVHAVVGEGSDARSQVDRGLGVDATASTDSTCSCTTWFGSRCATACLRTSDAGCAPVSCGQPDAPDARWVPLAGAAGVAGDAGGARDRPGAGGGVAGGGRRRTRQLVSLTRQPDVTSRRPPRSTDDPATSGLD